MTRQSTDLGPLEMQVFGILDSSEQPLSVSEVREQLEASGHPLAYTTVMTVLTRLFEKQAAKRTKHGIRFLYSPSRSSKNIKTDLLARMRKALFQKERVTPILALIQSETLTTEELTEIKKTVEDRLKKKKRK